MVITAVEFIIDKLKTSNNRLNDALTSLIGYNREDTTALEALRHAISVSENLSEDLKTTLITQIDSLIKLLEGAIQLTNMGASSITSENKKKNLPTIPKGTALSHNTSSRGNLTL